MTSVQQRAISFTSVALLACIACDEKQYDETKLYNDPSQESARPAGEKESQSRRATPLSKAQRASTANQLAEARCEREQRCNNVGQGRKYASQATCMKAVTSEWREELDDYACPGGTVPGALDHCLSEIRTEGCESPLASLERIVDCDTHEVCRNSDPRP